MIPAAALSLTLLAQDPTALPSNCTRAPNTLEVNACVGAQVAREDARLQMYLQRARDAARARDEVDRASGGPSAQRGYLDASQATWEAYADIVCGGVFDEFKDGTIRVSVAGRCRIDLTRERTHVVWRHFLTYADSTPPLLPEPAGPAASDVRSAPPSAAPPSTP